MKDFSDTVPTELLPILDTAFLWDTGDLIADEKKLAKEWTATLQSLQEDHVRVRIAELSRSIKSTKAGSDEVRKLEQELTDATKVLTALVKSGSV